MKKAVNRSSRARKSGLEAPEEKPLFLREGMDVPEEEVVLYDLQKEYGISKTNRSRPVYTALLVFALLLGGTTYWFTRGIQRDIDRTRVGIEDFRDLNLQELLNSLQRAQSELDKMDETIALAKRRMGSEIDKIRYQSALEIKKVEQSGLGQAEKQRLTRALKAEEARKVAEQQKAYDARLKDKKQEAEEARLRLEAYRRKMALEKADYDRSMSRNLWAQKKDADDQEKIHQAKLDEQRNAFLTALKKYEGDLKILRESTKREMDKSADLDNLLKLYRQALVYYAKSRGEHGYVIDPGRKGEILVDVNPYITLKKGDRAYVLNKDNRVVAIASLRPAGRYKIGRASCRERV